MSFTLDVFTISFFSGTFFISFSSPTFIIYLSLCLILCLSLLFISLPRSLQTRPLSLFRHINYPRLFLSLTLSLSPATLTHFTVFCFGRNLSVFLSPSLSFFSHVNRHLSNMYTHYRSLSHVVAFLHAAMLASLILLWCGPHLSLSLSLSSHTHPFYYLLLWTPPPSLSLSLSLSLFSHTPHFTLFCWVYSLSVSIFSHVNLHSSDTYTTPISLSLALSLSLSLALSLALSLSLSRSLSRSLSLSLSLFLSLSLQPHSPILLSSVVDATSLPFSLTLAFSLQPHSPTLLSSVGSTASLCLSSATLTVTLLTRTLPPSLSISLSLSSQS